LCCHMLWPYGPHPLTGGRTVRQHRSSLSREQLECQQATGRFSDLHPAAGLLPIPTNVRTVENILRVSDSHRSGRLQRRDRRGISPRSLCISERQSLRTCDRCVQFSKRAITNIRQPLRGCKRIPQKIFHHFARPNAVTAASTQIRQIPIETTNSHMNRRFCTCTRNFM
jgi:hypothetical protein